MSLNGADSTCWPGKVEKERSWGRVSPRRTSLSSCRVSVRSFSCFKTLVQGGGEGNSPTLQDNFVQENWIQNFLNILINYKYLQRIHPPSLHPPQVSCWISWLWRALRSQLRLCKIRHPYFGVMVAPRTSLERLSSNWGQLCHAPMLRQKSLIYYWLFKII